MGLIQSPERKCQPVLVHTLAADLLTPRQDFKESAAPLGLARGKSPEVWMQK